MKKICSIILLCFFVLVCSAQTYRFYNTRNYHNQLRLNTKTGEVMQVQDDGGSWYVCHAQTPDETIVGRYFLYPTQNMWTFIMVDSFYGKIWQCQFSVNGEDYIFSVPINETILSYSKHPKFEISPMTSMYQFYLTNGDTGEMWQFQWTTDGPDYRWIKKIR